MSKRRLKEEKISAKHPFLISWDEPSKNTRSREAVKGQFKSNKPEAVKNSFEGKKANLLVKDEDTTAIKHDIFKSLILVSLVLGLELMLYFVWK